MPKFLALAVFIALASPPVYAGCDDELRGVPTHFELLKVRTVAFGEVLGASLEDRLRQDLMNGILTRPVYSEPKAPGHVHRSALVGYVDTALGRELMARIHFDFEGGHMTVAALRPQIGELDQHDAFLKIGKDIYPEGDAFLEIRAGFLAGFDLGLHPGTLVKLAVKHKVPVHEVLNAFKGWADGRVVENEPDSTHPNAGVYTIIARLRSGKYLRVVFAWNPPAPDVPDDFVPAIYLITAFYTNEVSYRQHRYEAVELRD